MTDEHASRPESAGRSTGVPPATRPYSAYRDSELRWLGEVPEHWDERRVAAIADLRVSNVDKHVREDEEPIRLCNYVDVYHNDRIRSDIPFMRATAKKVDVRKFRMVIGDVLLTKDSENWMDIGVPALVDYAADDLICGYHLAILRPNCSFLDARYLFLVCGSPGVARQFRVAAHGVTRYGLSRHAIRSVRIPLPPVVEQQAIARFLDHADRRIQRYIRAKERLVELLEEQKQAMIHQAVTGQIDVHTGQPYPAYKHSGVVRLGEVPEHWGVRRLKTFSQIRYGLGQPPRETPDGLPLVRATNVSQGRIVEEDMVYVDPTDVPAGRNAFLSEGEIIVVRSGAYTADSAIIPKRYSGAVTGYDMVVTVTEALPEFVAWAALAAYVRDDQLVVTSLRAAQPHLNAEELGSACFFLPPLPEQIAIVRVLDATDWRIQRLVSATKRQIALLREYRTRLIADVVTGKLDVREAAADLPETDPLPVGESERRHRPRIEPTSDRTRHA